MALGWWTSADRRGGALCFLIEPHDPSRCSRHCRGADARCRRRQTRRRQGACCHRPVGVGEHRLPLASASASASSWYVYLVRVPRCSTTSSTPGRRRISKSPSWGTGNIGTSISPRVPRTTSAISRAAASMSLPLPALGRPAHLDRDRRAARREARGDDVGYPRRRARHQGPSVEPAPLVEPSSASRTDQRDRRTAPPGPAWTMSPPARASPQQPRPSS